MLRSSFDYGRICPAYSARVKGSALAVVQRRNAATQSLKSKFLIFSVWVLDLRAGVCYSFLNGDMEKILCI